LIQKETEIKAYAIELEALIKFRDGACDYTEMIAKLKKTIEQ